MSFYSRASRLLSIASGPIGLGFCAFHFGFTPVSAGDRFARELAEASREAKEEKQVRIDLLTGGAPATPAMPPSAQEAPAPKPPSDTAPVEPKPSDVVEMDKVTVTGKRDRSTEIALAEVARQTRAWEKQTEPTALDEIINNPEIFLGQTSKVRADLAKAKVEYLDRERFLLILLKNAKTEEERKRIKEDLVVVRALKKLREDDT